MGEFGKITSGGKLTMSEWRELIRKRDSATIKNYVKPEMTKDGSIMPYGKNATKTAPQPTTQTTSSKTASFGTITDAMGMLNQALEQITSGDNKPTSNKLTTSNSGFQTQSAGGNVGGSRAVGSDYSGYAQNVSSGIGAVNTSTLSRIAQDIEYRDWSMSSTDYSVLKADLAKESVNVNQSLAEAQANFSSLQSQKMTAEANVTRLEGAVEGAQNDTQSAQKTLNTSESNLNSSIQTRDKMDEQLSATNDKYKSDCDAVKSAEASKTSAQGEVSSAKTAKGQAEAAVSTAQQALSSAEATLAGTSPVNADGTPNPQYEVAKAAVEQAKMQKQQADEALKQAEQTLEQAQTKLDNAEKELSLAQEAKHNTLQTLQSEGSKVKDLAKKCEQMQNAVEQNQETYDTSLQTFDDTNANYERLNSELEAQEGILTQYEAVERQVESLKGASDTVKELEQKLNDKIQENKVNEANSVMTPEKKANIENGIMQNSASSEGCSASKTPLENLIASKGYDINQISGEVLQPGHHIEGRSANELASEGYIHNADGSFTDPRSGVTIVNVNGDDAHWLATDNLASPGYNAEYSNHGLAGRDWSDAVDAAFRAQQQKDVTLNGFDENGRPKFRWKNS